MENVFERGAAESPGRIISGQLYNLTIGLVLCWGFLVNWLLVKFVRPEAVLSVGFLPFMVGYFASCMAGVYLFRRSENPTVSFLGYNLVVVPFGLVVNIVVSQYDPTVVLAAIRVTGLVTVTMMVLGAMFPSFFQKIAPVLCISLLIVIVVELVEIFIFRIHHGILDWIVAAIFCGYIGYDWGRANRIPKTLDNAIDSAAALYMDIINLFLRILSIMGRRK